LRSTHQWSARTRASMPATRQPLSVASALGGA
jgi:hypothetical protein